MRIVGVDDGAFHPSKEVKQNALLLAVVFENLRISNLRASRIEVDGRDANDVLATLLKSAKCDVIMLSGISFGGFNVVDIAGLARVLDKPVIAVTGDRPHNEAVRKALRDHFPDWKDRWRMISSAGRIHTVRIRGEPPLYFEVRGGSPELAKRVIISTAVASRLPEPIRVARILAKGLSRIS
jgi:endonuclease V-like protein UPF0215 family